MSIFTYLVHIVLLGQTWIPAPCLLHLQFTIMGCWKTRNAQEWNGTEPEVIVAQYGCGHLICYGKLEAYKVQRADLASCTCHEDRTSTQQTV